MTQFAKAFKAAAYEFSVDFLNDKLLEASAPEEAKAGPPPNPGAASRSAKPAAQVATPAQVRQLAAGEDVTIRTNTLHAWKAGGASWPQTYRSLFCLVACQVQAGRRREPCCPSSRTSTTSASWPRVSIFCSATLMRSGLPSGAQDEAQQV